MPWVETEVIFGTSPQGPVGVDGSLGCIPGGSRGVDDGADIVRLAGFHIPFKEPGVFRFIFLPRLPGPVCSPSERVVIVGQPLVVPVNDLFEQGQFVLDLEELVHLLLILDDGKSGLGILGNDFYLRWGQIRIGSHGNPMVGLGRQLRIIPLRGIVADNEQPCLRVQSRETADPEPDT